MANRDAYAILEALGGLPKTDPGQSMDDIKKPQQGRVVPLRPARRSFVYPADRLLSPLAEPQRPMAAPAVKAPGHRFRFKVKLPKLPSLPSPFLSFFRDMRTRLVFTMMAMLIVMAELITILSPYMVP